MADLESIATNIRNEIRDVFPDFSVYQTEFGHKVTLDVYPHSNYLLVVIVEIQEPWAEEEIGAQIKFLQRTRCKTLTPKGPNLKSIKSLKSFLFKQIEALQQSKKLTNSNCFGKRVTLPLLHLVEKVNGIELVHIEFSNHPHTYEKIFYLENGEVIPQPLRFSFNNLNPPESEFLPHERYDPEEDKDKYKALQQMKGSLLKAIRTYEPIYGIMPEGEWRLAEDIK